MNILFYLTNVPTTFQRLTCTAKSNSMRDSMHKRLYSKCLLYNSFTLMKYDIFLRSKKCYSNPGALAQGFERYFSTQGNMSCFPKVKELYKKYFQYNPKDIEA